MAKEMEEGKDFKVTEWTGADQAQTKHKNYECLQCQFSTLYEFKMQEHVDYARAHKHKWAFPVEGSEPEAEPRKVDTVY